jgi:hypothetical protein
VAPIVHEGLLRTISGSSSSPGREVRKSATPTTGHPGYASLAQANTSQTHGVSAAGVTPKGYESAVPSLSLGEACHDSLAPSVKPSLAPSKVPKLHEPVMADTSIKGCDSLALSITPNGHDGPASSNKTPKRHESAIVNTMLESSRSQGEGLATKTYDAHKPSTVPENLVWNMKLTSVSASLLIALTSVNNA